MQLLEHLELCCESELRLVLTRSTLNIFPLNFQTLVRGKGTMGQQLRNCDPCWPSGGSNNSDCFVVVIVCLCISVAVV